MLNIEEFVKKEKLFDDHYFLIRPLSVEGATADVWLALDVFTVSDIAISDIVQMNDDEIEKLGLVVAIKIYRPQNALDIEGEQRFRDEYMIVFNCHHTNLIHPTHFSIFKETPYLVLPYCKLGSSELLIGKKLDNKHIWKYILDVASGLAYLHSLTPPIVHQDIKPANILLDDTQHYAITDFGISSQKGGVHGYYYDEENSGTLAYMAPERFQEGSEPIPQSDIWAFGATLCEILTGQVPFGEEGGKIQVKTNAPLPKIHGVSADIQKLIHACLAKEAGDRPTANQIKRAAEAQRYPLKSKKTLYIILNVLAVALLSSVLYFFFKPNPKPVQCQPTTDEQYHAALNMLYSDNVDTMNTGKNLMDSLSKAKFLPAMHQMAFTYGWYANPESKRRKQILRIAYDDLGMPKEDKFKEKGQYLFRAMAEHKDSASYPSEEADAYYRMGVYYYYYNNDSKKCLEYWGKAYHWALKSNNDSIKKEIGKQLKQLKQYINNEN